MSLTSVQKLLRNQKFCFNFTIHKINYGVVLGPYILSSELLNLFLFVFTKNVLKERNKVSKLERKKERKEERRNFSIKTSFRIIKLNCKKFLCSLLNYATLVGNTKH